LPAELAEPEQTCGFWELVGGGGPVVRGESKGSEVRKKRHPMLEKRTKPHLGKKSVGGEGLRKVPRGLGGGRGGTD